MLRVSVVASVKEKALKGFSSPAVANFSTPCRLALFLVSWLCSGLRPSHDCRRSFSPLSRFGRSPAVSGKMIWLTSAFYLATLTSERRRVGVRSSRTRSGAKRRQTHKRVRRRRPRPYAPDDFPPFSSPPYLQNLPIFENVLRHFVLLANFQKQLKC